MPEYISAGVYIQELNSGARPIAGVGTTTLALLGKAERGPINTPVLVTSMADFTRTFGNIARYRIGATDYEFFYLGMALSLFFALLHLTNHVAHCFLPAEPPKVEKLEQRGSEHKDAGKAAAAIAEQGRR